MRNNRILFVGVGGFQQLAIKQLKAAGFYIIGVDGSKNASSQSLCDEFQVIDFKLVDEIINYGMSKKADFALSVECDPALDIVNQYNKLSAHNYISEQACQASKDKFIIRQLQKKLGLAHPEFYQIESFAALQKTISQHKNTIKQWVLKPKCSSGSRGVILLDNQSDLTRCYQQSKAYTQSNDEALILEEFVDGDEIAIDGFIHQGKLHVLTVSYKDRTPAPYLLDQGLFITADLECELVRQCQKQLITIFSELSPHLSSPFHVEMIQGKNKLFIVEFSFRGAGFNVFSQWIPQVTGMDTIHLLQQQTCLAPEIDFTVTQNKSVYIGFFAGQNGVLKSVSGLQSIATMPEVLAFQFYPKVGDNIHRLTSGADRIGHIVLAGETPLLLKNKFAEINSLLRLEYE